MKIKILIKNRYGEETIELTGDPKISPTLEEDMHQVAAILFACEFAINNHASAIRGEGESIRCHIEL